MREVDKRFADVAKEKEAFATGQEALKKGGQPQSPAEFKTTWDAMSEPERQQAVSGAARYVEDTLGLTDRERSRLKTILGGDYNEAKLRTMIGDEKAEAFMDAMQREDVFSNTRNKVVHGSRTLEGLEGAKAPGLLEGTGTARSAVAALAAALRARPGRPPRSSAATRWPSCRTPARPRRSSEAMSACCWPPTVRTMSSWR